jgi:hypothetical protein
MRTQEVYMNYREIAILNSLVTYAAENIPGGLKEREAEIAKIVGDWVLDGVPVCQVCPHCGTALLHDGGRSPWLAMHLDNPVHRTYWRMKKTFRKIRI